MQCGREVLTTAGRKMSSDWPLELLGGLPRGPWKHYEAAAIIGHNGPFTRTGGERYIFGFHRGWMAKETRQPGSLLSLEFYSLPGHFILFNKNGSLTLSLTVTVFSFFAGFFFLFSFFYKWFDKLEDVLCQFSSGLEFSSIEDQRPGGPQGTGRAVFQHTFPGQGALVGARPWKGATGRKARGSPGGLQLIFDPGLEQERVGMGMRLPHSLPVQLHLMQPTFI